MKTERERERERERNEERKRNKRKTKGIHVRENTLEIFCFIGCQIFAEDKYISLENTWKMISFF